MTRISWARYLRLVTRLSMLVIGVLISGSPGIIKRQQRSCGKLVFLKSNMVTKEGIRTDYVSKHNVSFHPVNFCIVWR